MPPVILQVVTFFFLRLLSTPYYAKALGNGQDVNNNPRYTAVLRHTSVAPAVEYLSIPVARHAN